MAPVVRKSKTSKRPLEDKLFKLTDFVTEHPQLISCVDVKDKLWDEFSSNIESEYAGETWAKYWKNLTRDAKSRRDALDMKRRSRPLSYLDLRVLFLHDQEERMKKKGQLQPHLQQHQQQPQSKKKVTPSFMLNFQSLQNSVLSKSSYEEKQVEGIMEFFGKFDDKRYNRILCSFNKQGKKLAYNLLTYAKQKAKSK